MILDEGCGVCKDAAYLAKRGFKLTGIDNNKETLEIGLKTIEREKLTDRIKIIEQDFFEFDFPHDRFECVINVFVLNFVKSDEEKLITQTYKSLKKGGIFFISIFADRSIRKDIRVFTREDIKKKLYEAGFNDVTIKGDKILYIEAIK